MRGTWAALEFGLILSMRCARRFRCAHAMAPAALPMITRPEAARAVLAKYDTFVFDCDGVVWRGDVPVPGVGDAIAHLAALGKRMFFVSNNSTKDRGAYVEKFRKLMEAEWVGEQHVFHSGYATALYLAQQGLTGRKVYVVGEAGLKREIVARGCEVVEDGDAGWAALSPDAEAARDAPDVAAVVIGMDFMWSITKLTRCAACLTANPKAQFVLTNPDTFNAVNGRRIPEAGSIAASVAAVIGRPPDVICGKPNPMLFETLAAANPDVARASTLMIGDRLDTDIKFGAAVGIDQLLVLTGAHGVADVPAADVPPTHIVDSVAELVRLAREA